jgi:PleD family two-component response regulator
MQTIEHASRRQTAPRPQKVVLVNGNAEILELLETVLDAGRYDMTFVETSGHAYTRIRQVQPDLVVVCMNFDDPEGFHLLSMLKLDAETRRIPVVTYAGGAGTTDDTEDDDDSDDDDLSAVAAPMTMN